MGWSQSLGNCLGWIFHSKPKLNLMLFQGLHSSFSQPFKVSVGDPVPIWRLECSSVHWFLPLNQCLKAVITKAQNQGSRFPHTPKCEQSGFLFLKLTPPSGSLTACLSSFLTLWLFVYLCISCSVAIPHFLAYQTLFFPSIFFLFSVSTPVFPIFIYFSKLIMTLN